MESRPTTDPDFVVSPTRPGWIAGVVLLVFIGGFVTFAFHFGG